jgi:type I restriction enzyme, S subunit
MSEKVKIPAIRFKGFNEDWEESKWSDTVDISTNMVDPKTRLYDELPHVAPGNIESFTGAIYDNVKLVKDENLISGKFHFKAGDVIYGKINPQLGKYFYAEFEGLTSADAYVLNAKNGLSQKFLFSLLQTDDFYKYSVSVSKRSGMPKINREELNAYNFLAPKIEEQERIGEHFLKVDNFITLQQRKYEKLKNIKKAMLDKMFPKNGSNVPEIRFAGFTDDWEERKLGDIVTAVNRTNPESTAPVMMISAASGFIYQSEKYSSDNAGKSLIKYILLREGELAYNHGASKSRQYGSCFDLKVYEARVPYVYHCFEVGNNNPDFIARELNDSRIDNQLRRLVSSGARMDGLLNISFDAYMTVTIPVPKIEEQYKISVFLIELDNLITLQQRKLEKLKNIKKACLEKMFV